MAENKKIANAGPLTVEALAANIKKGALGSYVFYGEEDYLKHHYKDRIYNSIMEEGMETFNYFEISFSPAVMTKEEACSRLADAIMAIPMMQDKKLIVVTDLAPASLDKALYTSFLHSLSLAATSDDTVLVVYCRANEIEIDYKWTKSALFKDLSAVSHPVNFEVQPRGKLIAWVKNHFTKSRILITDEAAGLLTDMCASRMTPLSFEIEKLICYAKYVIGGDLPKVDVEEVNKVAVPSEQDDIPFAMLNAAQKWKLTDMLTVLATEKEKKAEPIVVLASLSRIFMDMLLIKAAKEAALSPSEIASDMKMSEFRITKYLTSIQRAPISVLENALQKAYETDLLMKSTPNDPWVLLEKLIVEIYAPKSLRKQV